MFNKILIANRGDQPRSGAATKSNCMARAACAGDFTAEIQHV
jgi:hypothetical protein